MQYGPWEPLSNLKFEAKSSSPVFMDAAIKVWSRDLMAAFTSLPGQRSWEPDGRTLKKNEVDMERIWKEQRMEPGI